MRSSDTTSANEHLTPQQASLALAEAIEEIEAKLGHRVRLSWLGRQKMGVDATTKLLVENRDSHPVAVIICSRQAAPDLVARAAERAEQVRALVGETLGEVIPVPLSLGYATGLSYMILPCYRELASLRILRRIQWWRLRRPVLGWLGEAVAAAACHIGPVEAGNRFEWELSHLRDQHFVDRDLKRILDAYLARLKDGEWQPRHTFDHNDMWLGNVMLPRPGALSSLRPAFHLIDWGGANPRGYGIYDLVRVSLAFGLSDAALARETRLHCLALGSEIQDASGHLLASLGRLHRHIEHFPEARYLAVFQRCWRTLARTVEAAKRSDDSPHDSK
ncbi:MAG: hypothetical protein JJT88_12380 [Gammaproteobacteria bacterium]|nr:hypothetical protein [Gammaproteobacteria bacterium]